jgi:hypothetical protein
MQMRMALSPNSLARRWCGRIVSGPVLIAFVGLGRGAGGPGALRSNPGVTIHRKRPIETLRSGDGPLSPSRWLLAGAGLAW